MGNELKFAMKGNRTAAVPCEPTDESLRGKILPWRATNPGGDGDRLGCFRGVVSAVVLEVLLVAAAVILCEIGLPQPSF